MNNRTFGILAGVIGSALGAWWYTRRQSATSTETLTAPRPRGEVIFDNTPTAASDAPGSF
jgi:hypothetical protein